jgi:hemerythrin
MFKWKIEYETGVQLIDEQHKELFNIGNKAYALLKNEFALDKFDKIINILEELKDYCIYHFQCEEQYQLSIGYRKYFSHKVEHDDFIKMFKEVDTNKIESDQDKYIIELLTFILNWIDKHIIEKDKEIC